VNLITRFDPWSSKLCTCPPKLTFNPYTGCDHHCIYCYASSYIPKFHDCRPKKDLIPRLRREVVRLKGELVSISNSSDPYPNLEEKTGLTRKSLENLTQSNCKIQIITKSPLVVRDADILKKVPSMVALTITTDNENTAKTIEPHASSPSQRLKAAETLISKSIPVSVRIDPIIPRVNENAENLIKTLAQIGVKHITASTYKIKPDNWKRFSVALPETAEKLKPLYFERGEKIGGYTYLPRDLRIEIIKNIRALTMKYTIKFGVCRENLSYLNTTTCDGSWLLNTQRQ